MIDALPPLPLLLAVMATLLLGGTVKGAFGIGFPAVVMSILPFFADPALGVTILALPIVVTNIQQVLGYEHWRDIVRRFLVAGLATAVSILIVSQFLDDVPTRVLSLCVGIALVLFAVTGLFKVKLPVTESVGWQLGVGIGSGIIGGLTAVKAPSMIYAAALNLPRDVFVATAGFLFLSGGVGLLTGLLAGSMLNAATLPLSVAALVAGLAGFRLGALIRRHIRPELFRNLLLWLMLILGLRLVLMNLI